jgi:hypothetical protein
VAINKIFATFAKTALNIQATMLGSVSP